MSTPETILSLIEKINKLSKNFITGCNCIDVNVCKGACCCGSQEISYELCKKLIDMNLAEPSDFIRSDPLPFRIIIDPITKHCRFFDLHKNACKIYDVNLRPPQCCIFPITSKNIIYKCRIGEEFHISPENKKKLIKSMDKYIELSFKEAKEFNTIKKFKERLEKNYFESFRSIPPKYIHGIKEKFDEIVPLEKKQVSIELLEYCNQIECDISYELCEIPCDSMLKLLFSNLIIMIENYMKINTPKDEYYFQILHKFIDE